MTKSTTSRETIDIANWYLRHDESHSYFSGWCAGYEGRNDPIGEACQAKDKDDWWQGYEDGEAAKAAGGLK